MCLKFVEGVGVVVDMDARDLTRGEGVFFFLSFLELGFASVERRDLGLGPGFYDPGFSLAGRLGQLVISVGCTLIFVWGGGNLGILSAAGRLLLLLFLLLLWT